MTAATTRVDLPQVRVQPGPRRGQLALFAVAAGLLTLVIRLALHGAAFDLYGDEILYSDIGRSVVNGGLPQFGGLFFLHGPAFFYLEAGWQRLLGSPSSAMGWVYEMRELNAVLAAGTAAALVPLTARAGSLRAAGAVGLLFALDPFCIRQNDRVLLETSLMLWVALGYLVFTAPIKRDPSPHDWVPAVGAGLLFGGAILTKDEGALLTVLPLLACIALKWGPRRILSVITLGTTCAVYAVYVAVVALNGDFVPLWQAKTQGIQRMLGIVQITGFHSKGGGSLTARLVAEGLSFGTTYAALAVAVPALILVLVRGGQVARVMGLLYCAAGVTLAYAVVLGTLEEQELYLLIVPSLLIIPLAGSLLTNGGGNHHVRSVARWGRMLTATVLTVTLALTAGINFFTATRWLLQPDDGFAQLIQYITVHVPAGTRVGTLDQDIETPYSLGGRYDVGVWESPAALAQSHARYLIVEWAVVNEGYSDVTSAQVRQLIGNSPVIFSFRGRTYGNLTLYQLGAQTGHG
jgi:hypothetical protein